MIFSAIDVDPFPHCTFNVGKQFGRKCAEAFDDVDGAAWRDRSHAHSDKRSCPTPANWPDILQALGDQLTAPDFVAELAEAFGTGPLFCDPTWLGGGLHETFRGGLHRHIDFNLHPTNVTWRRAVNVLVYFTDLQAECDGGELALYDRRHLEVKRIRPACGLGVAFALSESSWHAALPLGDHVASRRSFACYYYEKVDASAAPKRHTTIYR